MHQTSNFVSLHLPASKIGVELRYLSSSLTPALHLLVVCVFGQVTEPLHLCVLLLFSC